MGNQQQQRGKAYSYRGECKAWHYNWWLRKDHGQCNCGHFLLNPNDETLKLVNDADIALQYLQERGLGANTLELLQQKIAARTSQGPPAVRVAETALQVTRVERQISQAIKEYEQLQKAAEAQKAKVAELVQHGARLRQKLDIARQERDIGDATSSTQSAGTRTEPPTKSRKLAAESALEAQERAPSCDPAKQQEEEEQGAIAQSIKMPKEEQAGKPQKQQTEVPLPWKDEPQKRHQSDPEGTSIPPTANNEDVGESRGQKAGGNGGKES